MKRTIAVLSSLFLITVFISVVMAQDKAKDDGKKSDDKGKWSNTVWKKVNNLAKEKRSFKVEKATTVAGVRGSEAEDNLLKQLYFRGGGKYPSRLELKNAIDILETSIKAAPNDPSVPESKFFIGQCHEQLNELDEAIDEYKEIIKYYPDSPHAADAREELNKLQKN